jgi:ankyrin repeat protein
VRIVARKKDMIERSCQGLVEFIQPGPEERRASGALLRHGDEVHLLASVPPVHLACLCQSPDAAAELLTCLLAARADPDEKDAQDYTPLRLLACRGNDAVGAAELAAMLLAAGAQPELADGRGRTAAWLAAQHNEGAMLRMLLEAGRAHPSVPDCTGTTPLWSAAARGSLEIALRLP